MPGTSPGIGVGVPWVKQPSGVCVPCTVNKFPDIVCPFQINFDVPTTPVLTLFGGDNGILPGEAGCPVVRHEVIVVSTGDDPDVSGLLKDSWNQVVLTQAAGLTTPWTLSLAEYLAFPSQTGNVDIYVRSYTCDDFSVKQDFCSTQVLP